VRLGDEVTVHYEPSGPRFLTRPSSRSGSFSAIGTTQRPSDLCFAACQAADGSLERTKSSVPVAAVQDVCFRVSVSALLVLIPLLLSTCVNNKLAMDSKRQPGGSII
jgi:hypothetical protein